MLLFSISTALAAPSNNSNGDVVLPPPPAYATPASAMHLPNLPPLGNPTDSSTAGAFTPNSTTLNAAVPNIERPPPHAAATPAARAPSKLDSTSPAATLLRFLKQRTGLSNLQEAELQAAQKRLLSGDEAGALHAAQTLGAELDKEARVFIVTDGNNLFSIAGMPQVYANSNLWPLLWWENQPLLEQPTRLRNGMQLKVLAHPSIDQVSLALDYARTHNMLTAPLMDRDLLMRMQTQ